MRKKLIALILVLALSGVVSAAIQWDESQSTAWEDLLNWDLGRLPTITDNPVKLYTAGGTGNIVVSSTGVAVGQKMQMKYGTVVLTIQSGADLLCDDTFEMFMGTQATINIVAGGVLNVAARTAVGTGDFLIGGSGATDYVNVYGILNVSSSQSSLSKLIVGNSGAVGAGYVNIGSTGVVNCDAYQIQKVSIPAYIDITSGGKMYVIGDVTGQVIADRDLGRFRGDGIAGNVVTSYNPGTNRTLIVVPEPVTVVLLGFGGWVVLFGRKR